MVIPSCHVDADKNNQYILLDSVYIATYNCFRFKKRHLVTAARHPLLSSRTTLIVRGPRLQGLEARNRFEAGDPATGPKRVEKQKTDLLGS